MDECSQYINRWYTKAGRVGDLDELSLPLGGDQLTRVRLQGTKSLRAGAHTATERFDNLHPIIVEFFHTLQDFLEAHEDFVITCGLSYFLSYIIYHFNMASLSDSPHHNNITKGVSYWTNVHKMIVFNTIMDEILADLYIPFDTQEKGKIEVDIIVHAQPPAHLRCTTTVQHGNQVNIPLKIKKL